MNVFSSAQWIWCNATPQADEYGEFLHTLPPLQGKTTLRLSCDSDYTLWVNGAFVSAGQYGDFEHYKIYDTVDLTPYLTEEINRLAILVWHFGTASQRYFPAPAGLIFEVEDERGIVSVSGTATEARMSRTYQNGRKKKITGQLGYGYAYDSTKEDGWECGMATGFSPSVPVDKQRSFHPRPIPKHRLAPFTEGKILRREANRILLDLGGETVGLLSFSLNSDTEQDLRICYGEHFDENGWIPRIIETRDFSIEYRAKRGRNDYTNYMLRFAGRYLEIQSEETIELISAGLIEQRYPSKIKRVALQSDLDRRIYDLCVNTLEKCMMEHYVDCPWREQCLYAFDSRNQMLCGYHVYEDGNFPYARANLMLFGQDRRDDRLLSICSPCGTDLTIPSFTLYYLLSVKEYTQASGDLTLAREVYPKLVDLIKPFLSNRKDGLVMRFSGKQHWNFYDWSTFSNGTLGKGEAPEPDGAINCLLILALDALKTTCQLADLPFPYDGIAEELRRLTKAAFFQKDKGLLTMRAGREEFTDLVNSLGVLTGVLNKEEALVACEKMQRGETVPSSLSMRIFRYEALINTDRDRYYPQILKEIRRYYKIMLNAGSDCAWETANGAEDFNGAGSLCHGWSAIPVLFLPHEQ